MDSETYTQKASKDIIFLDIDAQSFQMLGRPDMTPRDKIAELLNIAYQRHARIVILDIDFSEKDYTPAKIFPNEGISKTGYERDKELFDLIEKIKNDPKSQTQILIPFTTYADRTLKQNIFSKLIDNKKIFAVTPNLTVNRAGDNYARFWLPYLKVKDAQTNEEKILWSIPLFASVLYRGNFEELEKLQDKILNLEENFFTVAIKHGDYEENLKFYREREKNGGLMRDSVSFQYNRIQYVAIPPDVLTQFPFGTVPPSNIGHLRKNGLDNEKIDCQNKIVIIGRADEDCSDLFATPIGNLPGMYIHGNSIASILGNTRPHLTSPYKHILIELLLILIAAYAFLILSENAAKYFVFVLTIMCWVFTYIYFCLTNEFVYLCFAFTVVGVYNFVRNIQSFILVRGISIRNIFRRR